jgi:hypothetical protein
MEYFRPRGKIVCIGDNIKPELEIIQDILSTNNDNRLPVLLLSSNQSFNELADQVVIFDSDTTISQVHNLLNASFLFFIFNSNDQGIFSILGSILASIEYRGSIPIFIDTGYGLASKQRRMLGECYFHFDLEDKTSYDNFLIYLTSMLSVLSPTSGLGVSFSDLIQIFGKSKCLFYGMAFSQDLDELLDALVDQIGAKLVNALPEVIEDLEVILISVISGEALSLHQMNTITNKLINTFGKEFTIHFSNAVEEDLVGFKTLALVTDVHPIQEIIPSNTSFSFANLENQFSNSELSFTFKKDESTKENEEDVRFQILGKIFSESEVYIFDDGGLPLFASHRPAGQEVCLYTGLFSAIQSMSSDLIGHSPDHLTAGDKECFFVTQKGPNNIQLRGVAICGEGNEETARNDLKVTMDLVHSFMSQGEPEYAINDKIQSILVRSYQKGELTNGFAMARYQAS